MCNIMGTIGRVVCLTTILSAPLYAPSEKGKRAQEFKGELKGRIDPPPFRGEDDEPFYAEHRRKTTPKMPKIGKLKRKTDIRQYPFSPRVNKLAEERLHREFAKKRVRAKKYPTSVGGTEQHPDLTEPAVAFVQNQKDFLDDFVGYLKSWKRTDYYMALENKILDASRPPPQADGTLSPPTLDPQVRSSNQAYVRNLGTESDRLYEPIGGYLTYVNDCCRDGQIAELYKDWKRQHGHS